MSQVQRGASLICHYHVLNANVLNPKVNAMLIEAVLWCSRLHLSSSQ